MAFKKISNFHISGFRCFKQFLNIPSEEENVKRLLLLNRLIRIFIQGCKIVCIGIFCNVARLQNFLIHTMLQC